MLLLFKGLSQCPQCVKDFCCHALKNTSQAYKLSPNSCSPLLGTQDVFFMFMNPKILLIELIGM